MKSGPPILMSTFFKISMIKFFGLTFKTRVLSHIFSIHLFIILEKSNYGKRVLPMALNPTSTENEWTMAMEAGNSRIFHENSFSGIFEE